METINLLVKVKRFLFSCIQYIMRKKLISYKDLVFLRFDIDAKDHYTFKKGDTIGFSWNKTSEIPFVRTNDDSMCGHRIRQPKESEQVELKSEEFNKNIYFFKALYNPVSVD